MKADISIIIPIYKGGQYIPYWLEKIEKNTVRLDAFHLKCELILVNDFPEEHIKMEDFQPCGFTLKILNAEKNQGIHGARVYGLEHAEGEWVVFLDQDDWIVDDYLLKQKLCIGDADAVICNGYFKYFCMDICNFIYKDMEEQKRVKDLSFYISTGNPVYSPGQVMLKRKAVPQFWCQNRLKMNGADDYYLWILMLKAGKEFVLNKEKLYTHVGHGSNASNDIASMTCSIREVEEILETKGYMGYDLALPGAVKEIVTGFHLVVDEEEAVKLLTQAVAAEAKRAAETNGWGTFMAMNRTFFHYGESLYRYLHRNNMVFTDGENVLVLGARMLRARGLHVGFMAGDYDKCLAFAASATAAQGLEKLSIMFPPERADLHDLVTGKGYAQTGELIVMELDRRK